MKRSLIVLLAVYAMAPGLAAEEGNSRNEKDRTEKDQIEKDIVYSAPGKATLKLDLALPARKAGTRSPVLICIHGGGWHFGKRQDMHRFIRGAAERGYVAISPAYRFAPAFKWPAQRDDMRAVLAWMQANAEKLALGLLFDLRLYNTSNKFQHGSSERIMSCRFELKDKR